MRPSHRTLSIATRLACSLLALSWLMAPSTGAADEMPRTDLLGFNDHPLDGRAPAPPGTMLDRLVELGGTFVRIDVHWPWFEWAGPGRSNWNPDQVRLLDEYLTAAHARRLEVQLTVQG